MSKHKRCEIYLMKRSQTIFIGDIGIDSGLDEFFYFKKKFKKGKNRSKKREINAAIKASPLYLRPIMGEFLS